ncbi:hypothetical protein ACFWAT_22755 [Streptomyces syringium]|uniref:hypothetical protein n=1 Tax=Streptomyces syringium TaxID=76729 RepID=UPI003647DA77
MTDGEDVRGGAVDVVDGAGGAAGASGPGGPVGSTAKLEADLEQLKSFQGRVDALLTDLTGSEGGPDRLTGNRLAQAVLGKSFGEADALYSAYDDVHTQLATLSQLLFDQIEALGTAIHASRVGYANIDQEARERMWAIQARAKEHYNRELDPHPAKDVPSETSPQPSPKPTPGSQKGSI